MCTRKDVRVSATSINQALIRDNPVKFCKQVLKKPDGTPLSPMTARMPSSEASAVSPSPRAAGNVESRWLWAPTSSTASRPTPTAEASSQMRCVGTRLRGYEGDRVHDEVIRRRVTVTPLARCGQKCSVRRNGGGDDRP
jgi:hypothetical protein